MVAQAKARSCRLATALVGRHNAVSTTLKEMENNRFETARYYGARLVQITDSDKYGGSLDTLKALTGRVEMWRGSIRFGLLFPSLSFDGVLIALP